uniref:Uncharacterized protein n=1 Tax=Trypanosoma vivax (strain Y486) TaxID=1055687 RepID=G0U7M1_TRYVY|nr:hypothetical protein TVY486_1009240 [Trypanosoma vivax Y486]
MKENVFFFFVFFFFFFVFSLSPSLCGAGFLSSSPQMMSVGICSKGRTEHHHVFIQINVSFLFLLLFTRLFSSILHALPHDVGLVPQRFFFLSFFLSLFYCFHFTSALLNFTIVTLCRCGGPRHCQYPADFTLFLPLVLFIPSFFRGTYCHCTNVNDVQDVNRDE